MSNQLKDLKKGDILFREGDPSDAMYVIKKGRLSVTKSKGSGEIELAELGPGEMLGEMAFFDNKPRSAGAKAKQDATIIVLPFSALYAQFKTFPEWLKAMVKNINGKLRDANAKIKNLESNSEVETTAFTPYMITRLCAIIALVGYKAGTKEGDGLLISYFVLRNYCIQIFQAPTTKLDLMMDALAGMQIMKVEDLEAGQKKVTILKHEFLAKFVDWYNEYLFKDESKRVTITEKELPGLRALAFYGGKATPNEKGEVVVSLTDIQNNSMKDLGILVNTNATDSLAEKKLVQEKQSGEGGSLTQKFLLSEVTTVLPYWELVFALLRISA
ncbi:MAG: Crp/Fnr family transcriptional regulator [Bdellovibrionales bacterium]